LWWGVDHGIFGKRKPLSGTKLIKEKANAQ
jgi:hypothetical protein